MDNYKHDWIKWNKKSISKEVEALGNQARFRTEKNMYNTLFFFKNSVNVFNGEWEQKIIGKTEKDNDI